MVSQLLADWGDRDEHDGSYGPDDTRVEDHGRFMGLPLLQAIRVSIQASLEGGQLAYQVSICVAKWHEGTKDGGHCQCASVEFKATEL